MDITLFNGLKYQIANYYKTSMTWDANSLLNTKFNVLPDYRPSATTYPSSFFMVIGNGGKSVSATTTTGVLTTTDLPYLRTWASLYNHIPFVVRLATNDLTPTQRANYGLRVPVTINNIAYIFYYAKRISFSSNTISAKIQTISNGVVLATNDYVTQATDLSPTAPVINSDGTSTYTNAYVTAVSTLDVSLTQAECQEIYNACNIIYGATGNSNITEIGIGAGVDKAITIASDNSSFSELGVAQIMSIHTGSTHVITSNTTGAGITVNVGLPLPVSQTSSTVSSES